MDVLKRYRCLVIDDEEHAIELLSDFIRAIPQLQLIKSFQDPIAALMETAADEPYDFIFMDIDMPRLSGIELAQSLRDRTKLLVFTTAHPRYAVDAFEVRADHFLLKPIGLNKFAVVIRQLLEGISLLPQEEEDTADKAFFIKSEQKSKFIKVLPHDIIAIEGLKNYIIIFTKSEKHIAYLTMKEAENALNRSGRFIRVHKSFIVAKHYIEAVNGRMIRMHTGIEVPVGETYRQTFLDYVTSKAIVSSRS